MKTHLSLLLAMLLLASLACNLPGVLVQETLPETQPPPTQAVSLPLVGSPPEATPTPLETPTPIETPPPDDRPPTEAPPAEQPSPLAPTPVAPVLSALDASPPAQTVKLIFIHHSSGENWLADDNGGLALALMANNYFVSDTNYGWGPDAIGDRTDIGNWWEWFAGPDSSRYLQAVFNESGQNSWYTRLDDDPGGQNTIILFKSCFPNSAGWPPSAERLA